MVVKIKNVKVVPGSNLSKYWKSDMQVVTTDKGKYIDNAVDSDYAMGHDWKDEIGCYASVKINNSKEHKWINYKGEAHADNDSDNDNGSEWQGYVLWAIIILIGIVVYFK